MANLVESGELVVKFGVKGGEVYFPGGWRRVKMLQESSRFLRQTSRNFKELQRENSPKTPETALNNLEVWPENLEVS